MGCKGAGERGTYVRRAERALAVRTRELLHGLLVLPIVVLSILSLYFLHRVTLGLLGSCFSLMCALFATVTAISRAFLSAMTGPVNFEPLRGDAKTKSPSDISMCKHTRTYTHDKRLEAEKGQNQRDAQATGKVGNGAGKRSTYLKRIERALAVVTSKLQWELLVLPAVSFIYAHGLDFLGSSRRGG